MKRGGTIFVLALMASGCGSSAPAVVTEPPELAPLPPTSRTVIGYLLYRADELKLDADQRKALEQIDDDLEVQNGPLEEVIDGRPGGSGQGATPGRGGGRRGRGSGGMGGGMGGGGMGGGGMRGGGRGGGMGGGAPAAGSATTAPKPEEAEARKRRAEDAATARQQMVENERAALAEALSVLTPDQQAQAATLLRERAAKMGRARPPAAGPQGQQAPRQGHPRGGRGDGDGDGD